MKDLINRLREIKNRWADEGNVASEAAEALEAQQAEIEALRADAERYRWLREYWTRIVSHMDTPFDIRFEVIDKHWGTLPPDVIDAATDAARRK